MGLTFLAPLFLGGILLLGIPYLIHRIRRPERETLAFSSIMFIPNAPREIIERRRIQHILLMLLRMLVFLLLALAFARPVWRVLAASDGETGPARHLVMLDTSYSMQAPGVFDRAKAAAREVIANIPDDEPVAVMAFDQRQTLTAPYESTEEIDAGTTPAARRAIEIASPTLYATNYLGALEAAQRLLLGSQRITLEDAPSERLVLHVVSDFTKAGMPDDATGWKLSPSIELETYRVAPDDAMDNMAIMDIAVKKSADGMLRVVGKVKNWSKRNERDLPVRLYLNGEQVQEKSMTIQAGNASQVSFALDQSGAEPIEGWFELPQDGLSPDNRRYFAWSPPRRQRLLLVGENQSSAPTFEGASRWPAAFFLERALQPEGGLPFDLERVTPQELGEELVDTGAGLPDLVVVPQTNTMTPEALQALRDYISKGGDALIVWGAAPDAELLNRVLLTESFIEVVGPAHDLPAASDYALFSWLDFEHPIFAPFQGARFNDFSTLRFFNHHRIQAGDEAENVRIIARFDTDDPAVVQWDLDEGTAVLWPFAVDLDWTNFPKSPRFVPILYETLTYLSGAEEGAGAWTVGDTLQADAMAWSGGATELILPASETPATIERETWTTNAAPELAAPGFVRSRAPQTEQWTRVDAVNVDADESDPTPVDLAEFKLKLAAAPAVVSAEEEAAARDAADERLEVRWNYGRWFLAAVCLLVLFESWYMTSLRR